MNKACEKSALDTDISSDEKLTRVDAPLKVTGKAVYASEWYLQNIATGVMVCSTITSGSVVSINTATLLELPGVLAVITDPRMLRNPAQGTAGEAPVQGPEQVFFRGQPIAVIVAESFEQARHAAQQARVEYKEEEASIDPYAEDVAVETPEDKQFSQGDLEEATASANFVVDEIYTTPAQSHAAMEPHSAIAHWQDEKLEVYASCQMLKFNRKEIADSLKIDPEKVRMITPFVGGGFGGKLGISHEAVAAAIAARQLKRPVKIALTRPQVFTATTRRTETRQRIRLTADAEGRLTGIGHEYRVSNLPGEDFSEPVAMATHFLYGGSNRKILHEVARVNQTCAGSMRAPGEAVGMLALENAMDELAVQMNMDPLQLRLINMPERHPEKEIPYSQRDLKPLLERGAEHFGWNRRVRDPGSQIDGEWFVGMGMALAARTNLTMDAEVKVTLKPDGSALVETDLTDLGTGSYTMLTRIVADMLGVDAALIDVKLGDTDFPSSPGSGGSWGAGSTGSAALLACQAIHEEIALRLNAHPDELAYAGGKVCLNDNWLKFTDILDEPLEATGTMKPGEADDKRMIASFGAHFAEVGVNRVTGEVRVRRMLGIFDAGRILNRNTARSQCMGGMIFGIGSALTEELLVDPQHGHIVNASLAEYHVPVHLDVPDIDVIFMDTRDTWANPMHAKGIGELGISGAGAAITNAIFNACGIRVRDYPATLDKLLAELPEIGLGFVQ